MQARLRFSETPDNHSSFFLLPKFVCPKTSITPLPLILAPDGPDQSTQWKLSCTSCLILGVTKHYHTARPASLPSPATPPSKSLRFPLTCNPPSTRCLPVLILTVSRLPTLPTRPIAAVRLAADSSAISRISAFGSDASHSSGSPQTSSDKMSQGSCSIKYPLRAQRHPSATNLLLLKPPKSSPSNSAVPAFLTRPTQT